MSPKDEPLLAKRSKTPDRPGRPETLAGHTLEVVAVAKTLVHSWGSIFLGSTGLPENWRDSLLSALVRGAALHDLGKANHQFQRLVRSAWGHLQAFRHEWLSLFILLRFPALDQWLFPERAGVVRQAAVFAALGHHLEVPDGSALSPRDGSGDSTVVVRAGHPDVRELLEQAAGQLGLPRPAPTLTDVTIDLLADDPLVGVRFWLREAKTWWDRSSAEEKRLIALVKALLVAADVAGSAIPRKGVEAAPWVQEVLFRTCTQGDIERLALRGLEGKPLRPFQAAIAGTPSRITLARAGCGSGKTVAAYLWASRRATGRKLFFCYPTTGTATEGYAGYVLPEDVDAALTHSRAEVDLEDLIGTFEDTADQQMRLEALGAWDVPLIVCTADTVLGLVQNNRRGLFSFPAIANGAFVFDEVHAFDERMFGALLRFLDAFRGVPVLLMTASLPEARLQALKEVADRLGEGVQTIQGPRDLEVIPRYRLQRSSPEEAWTKAVEVLTSGGKVLWVANQVDRAVAFAKEALRQSGSPPLLYHSRYRYGDRVAKHRAVMEAFTSHRAGPALAITTQVCEVSLNLSADLLVTDLAPIPALIQRLGRLNRHVTPTQPGYPRPGLILEPGTRWPYEGADLAAAQRWLDRLVGGPTSQADLARAFLEVVSDGAGTEGVQSAWLDGGPFSTLSPLKEAGTTLPVIRAEDAVVAREDRRHVVRLTIPMLLGPVITEVAAWPRLGMARVAPSGRVDYSEEWGAAWRK